MLLSVSLSLEVQALSLWGLSTEQPVLDLPFISAKHGGCLTLTGLWQCWQGPVSSGSFLQAYSLDKVAFPKSIWIKLFLVALEIVIVTFIYGVLFDKNRSGPFES